jgi:hypothetical protein
MANFVFGPSGQENPSPYSTESSSNGSKENPLLETDTTNGMAGRNGRQRFKAAREGRAVSFCGCLGHLMILFLPIIATVFMLAFLIVLAVFDRSEIQQTDLYGDEEIYELAEIYYASISSDTISLVMSQYAPYPVILALASVSCVLMSMVTVARNIQIEVYHKRIGSIIFMKFINYLAAIINILAYAGLMVAVNFKVTQEEPEYAVQAHFLGFLTFFGGTATYSVLHSFLMWNQGEYPTPVKVLFFLLALVIVGSSLAFGIPIWMGGITSDEGANPVFEWVAVFASALSMGFYLILFFIDPVDDELGAFFCRGSESKRTKRKRVRPNSRQQIDLQQYPI